MLTFVLRRIATLLPQLLIVVVGTFFLLRLLPADPAAKAAGAVSTPEARLQAAKALGLDAPLWEQLWVYLKGMLTGDLGKSWSSGQPVLQEILGKFPITLQFVVLGFVLALLIAIPLGRRTAARPGGTADKIVLGYALFAGAQPEFWWGLIFVFVFSVTLGWLPIPTGGLLSVTTAPPPDTTGFVLIDSVIHGYWAAFGDALAHLVLPVVTLAFVMTGPLLKMTRQSVLAVANSDYLVHQRAIGLPHQALSRTMLRNSLAPVVTLTGILFGFMLGGAVLIENVFALEGIGSYALRGVLNLDYPVVQGAVIVLTTSSLLIYLLMDILYAALDPRVRLES